MQVQILSIVLILSFIVIFSLQSRILSVISLLFPSYLPSCLLLTCLPAFLPVSQESLFFIPLLFFSVRCSKVCVCVMFSHDYDFFFKADSIFSGHHIRRHMLPIYNITDSDNFGYLIKLSLPMTIFSFVTSYFYINTVSVGNKGI